MSERRTAERGDLHGRFREWLLAGTSADPPRDVALHASVCPSCALAMSAFDALAAIDPGRAMLPPSRVVTAPRRGRLAQAGRLAAAVAGVALAAALTGVGLSQLGSPGGSTGGADQTPAQGVLGGTGQPSPTGPQASGFDGGVTSGSPTPGASFSAPPTAVPQPSRTGAPTPRPATPAPTASGTPAATASPTPGSTPSPIPTASPTPSPSPTPMPTPSPIPTPEPTAAPPQCADGQDNDLDGATDYPDDPECVDAQDNDESI